METPDRDDERSHAGDEPLGVVVCFRNVGQDVREYLGEQPVPVAGHGGR